MRRLRDARQRATSGAEVAPTPWRSCACLTAPTAVRYHTSRWWRYPPWLR